MTAVILTRLAARDIQHILRISERDFGLDRRNAYKRLIDRAIRDIGDDPLRQGVRLLTRGRRELFQYHLKWNSIRTHGLKVRSPRHSLVFRQHPDDVILIVGIAHERELLDKFFRR